MIQIISRDNRKKGKDISPKEKFCIMFDNNSLIAISTIFISLPIRNITVGFRLIKVEDLLTKYIK